MPRVNPIERVYHRQRAHTLERGAKWRFTLKSWCKYWECALGPDWLQLRGKSKGKFCMERIGDRGPFSPRNVRIVLFTEHRSDIMKTRVPTFLGRKHSNISKQRISASKREANR
jgi:hypothetical protein